jgi:uncharacterized ion transporter superfamily protein YfcC
MFIIVVTCGQTSFGIVNSAIYIDPFVPKVVMVGYDSVFCSLLFSCASPSSMLMFRVNLSLEVYASNDS